MFNGRNRPNPREAVDESSSESTPGELCATQPPDALRLAPSRKCPGSAADKQDRQEIPARLERPKPVRVGGVDSLRGIVIVLMALDHCRDFFSVYPFEPTDLDHASSWLFITRWVTHFCAPVFLLLTGCSAWLRGRYRGLTRGELQRYLVSRGLWLVLLEVTWNNFMWRFNLDGMQVQVLWVIGWSMVFLALLLWLPRTAIIAVGLAVVIGHNVLDSFHASSMGGPDSGAAHLWELLHESHIWFGTGGFQYDISYPLLPWIGLTALGYGLGAVFEEPAEVRDRILVLLGLLLVVGFVLLRLINAYGEPRPWSHSARGSLYTVLGFLNLTKYPPSLQFLIMTLGPALLVVPILSRWNGRITNVFRTFGQVPMFFYLLHIPFIHAESSAVRRIAVVFDGRSHGGLSHNFGPNLVPVYLAWFVTIAALYPVCRWYAGYKRRNSQKWWLSYL
jgi:uncharacterized membrane protein